jgi:type IV pilus assembly protein PilA
MKKQAGFTIIELLLVLGILGIISAITLPVLLGQRARARDKSAIANLDNVMSDGLGQWDKGREAGSLPAAILTKLAAYLNTNHGSDRNPWNQAMPAYASSYSTLAAAASQAAFLTAMTTLTAPASLGQVRLYIQLPTSTSPGFQGGAVKLSGPVNGATTFRKATGIE